MVTWTLGKSETVIPLSQSNRRTRQVSIPFRIPSIAQSHFESVTLLMKMQDLSILGPSYLVLYS